MVNDINESTPAGPQPSEGGGSGKVVGIISVIVLLVLLVGVGLMFGRGEEAPATNEVTSEVADEDSLGLPEDFPVLGDVTNEDMPAAQGEVKEFTVAASNFVFDPSEMRVNQGDTVRITLTNDSQFPHDWSLDEFNAATQVIQTGQEDTVEFVAGQAGEFEYYCSVGNHRQMGMVGKLIVE